MFSSVAERYDLMNDLMSFGIHRLVEAIHRGRPRACGKGQHVLDLAGGTGDLARLVRPSRVGAT